MTSAFVTTSYAPDFHRFARLHSSILEHSDLTHFVFVPEPDLDLFRPLARSGRLQLASTREVLPSSIVSTEWLNRTLARIPRTPSALRIAALNTHRPWPPLRGWILQQLVKLSAADHVGADTLIFIDSDVQLIRPVTATTFRREGVTRLYRLPGGVHAGMTRHRVWHRTARDLLKIDGPEALPYDDFIAGLTPLDAALARDCTARVAQVAGRPWQTAIGRCLDFSEYILYGEYVKAFASSKQRSFVSDRSLCHSYWQREPMDLTSAGQFVAGIGQDDVAIHLQSNAHLPTEVEDFIRAAVRAVTR